MLKNRKLGAFIKLCSFLIKFCNFLFLIFKRHNPEAVTVKQYMKFQPKHNRKNENISRNAFYSGSLLIIYRVIHDLSPPCPDETTVCVSIICISLEVYFISGYKSKFSYLLSFLFQ